MNWFNLRADVTPKELYKLVQEKIRLTEKSFQEMERHKSEGLKHLNEVYLATGQMMQRFKDQNIGDEND